MQGALEPSKLCNDIFELEKDFRYNLFLLRVRDTEIARCKTQNEHFLRELKQKEEDNSTIRIKLRETESELKSANTEKVRMRISYEETIVGLNTNLAELKKAHENYIREQRSQEKKLSVEFQERCKELMESKEKEHQGEIAEMNDRLQREMCLTQKLKSQLQEITTQNISLRNELQEKQSHYISRISILESELKSCQEEKRNIEMKLDSTRKDYAYFEKELRRIITEKDQIKKELSESDERNRNLQRELKDIYVEKDNLNHQLNTTTLELETYLANLTKAMEEKDKLETEFKYFKQVAEQQKCTDPEHENIVQQNSVLQEVVKAMRRERSEALNVQEMEKKMKNLESLVECLKASMLNNIN